MVGFRLGRSALVVLMVGLAGVACEESTSVGATGTMVLGFGSYSIEVAIPSGVSNDTIVLTEDVVFGAAFFTSDGEPDERIMEPRFRLDAAALDSTFVKFVRGTAFTGTLQRIAPGQTEIHFSLYDDELAGYSFNAVIPITVN